eukprot:TRINITY_DN10305_c0_g1_i1.p1 TRINITY_DN10305_c0_g1~~TRINITY_DN10305_c0_g1_i1.p1  ORF type:complete len:227 (-),score=31.11 TRINITY_DN10305_c0_g1_i1:73-753(-)
MSLPFPCPSIPLPLTAVTSAMPLLPFSSAIVGATNKYNETPLHDAARTGHFEVLSLLLDKGHASTQGKNTVGYTPLHFAAENGHARCARALLEAEAEVDARNNDDWTPLHRASLKGYTQCVELLIEYGADPNIQDKFGETPLHMAVSGGHTGCIDHLLNAGGNIYEKRFYGHTPLDNAKTQAIKDQLLAGPTKPIEVPVTDLPDEDGLEAENSNSNLGQQQPVPVA